MRRFTQFFCLALVRGRGTAYIKNIFKVCLEKNFFSREAKKMKGVRHTQLSSFFLCCSNLMPNPEFRLL